MERKIVSSRISNRSCKRNIQMDPNSFNSTAAVTVVSIECTQHNRVSLPAVPRFVCLLARELDVPVSVIETLLTKVEFNKFLSQYREEVLIEASNDSVLQRFIY